MKLLLVGVTGLVGSYVLRLALDDDRITHVHAISRRALSAHPKLINEVMSFDELPEHADIWRVDAVICTLGTTMRIAGSREAFRKVDYDYPLTIAKIAKQHAVTTYVLNSAIGANPHSRFFYNQVKGELERDLAALGFDSLTLVKPGLIEGPRPEVRVLEQVSAAVLRTLEPLLPKAWRLNPAEHIAEALLEAAIAAKPGQHSVLAADLAR